MNLSKFREGISPVRFYVFLLIAFLLFMVIFIFIAYMTVINDVPSVYQLENPKQDFATQIFSNDGELIDHYYKFRRVSLPFDSIPQNFINALIATEDKRFYSHWGVHVQRIMNAMIKNVFSGRVREGGSTITMQLARNLFFTQEGTISRKIREAVTAIAIEKTYTKNEILALYINTVAFGRGTYGIKVASNLYFDKEPMNLSLSECAFLVGLLKAPEHYNGLIDYDRAITRRNLVLSLMSEQDYINQYEYNKALNEPINLARSRITPKGTEYIAPHFVEMIRKDLSDNSDLSDYDIYRDGLIVYTTLDSKIQKYAKEALEEHINEYQKIFNRSFSWNSNRKLLDELIKKAVRSSPEYSSAPKEKKQSIENKLRNSQRFVDSLKNAATTLQAGLVVIDPTTGEILAMVGASPKFMLENAAAKYSLNHAVQIKRQPGSSFKPFVYASSLIDGMNPNDMIECGPFSFKLETGEVWSPSGTGDCSPGQQVTMADGLARSINTVAARLITEHTSPIRVIELANRMGIKSPLMAVPALSLGAGGDVSPFEMVVAYCAFANEGVSVEPYSVKRVEDRFGNVLIERKKKLKSKDALKQNYAHIMTRLMQGVVDHGTASEIRKYFTGVDAAGKTGTTNDYADAWFIGYTPQLVAGLWVGFDDKRVTFTGGYGYASKAAAPVWGKLMKKIYSDPTLPYKQKRFSFAGDSTDSINIVPSEIEHQPQTDLYNLKSNNKKLKNSNLNKNISGINRKNFSSQFYR
jgi:penicillin-binding protein 1A